MLDRLATPAYYEGEWAAACGGREDHNPYVPGTRDHEMWRTGFQNERYSAQAPE